MDYLTLRYRLLYGVAVEPGVELSKDHPIYRTKDINLLDPFASPVYLGRLYQVEYAMEAISHASTALGILAKDGLVIAAEKKVASKLLDETTGGEKIYIINE